MGLVRLINVEALKADSIKVIVPSKEIYSTEALNVNLAKNLTVYRPRISSSRGEP